MHLSFKLAAAMLVLTGCSSKTEAKIYAETRQAAEPLRLKTTLAAGLVDKAKPPAPGASCKGAKQVTFDPKSDAHDTDFMMLEEAKRGGAAKDDRQKDDDIDLHFGTNPFARMLRGTSAKSPYPEYMINKPPSSDLFTTMKRALNVKNLIMVRARGLGTMDYFLVDLASPSIVCGGTFEVSSTPGAGTRTETYDLVTKNKRTGKEIARETKVETHDDDKSARYKDASTKLVARLQTELGITSLE